MNAKVHRPATIQRPLRCRLVQAWLHRLPIDRLGRNKSVMVGGLVEHVDRFHNPLVVVPREVHHRVPVPVSKFARVTVSVSSDLLCVREKIGVRNPPIEKCQSMPLFRELSPQNAGPENGFPQHQNAHSGNGRRGGGQRCFFATCRQVSSFRRCCQFHRIGVGRLGCLMLARGLVSEAKAGLKIGAIGGTGLTTSAVNILKASFLMDRFDDWREWQDRSGRANDLQHLSRLQSTPQVVSPV